MSHFQDKPQLDDLRVLVAVGEHASLTAAGLALGLPKQTVSRRVEALEAALGLRLVERSPQRTRLTEDGALLAERARDAIRLADEALDAVRDARSTPTGTLRLTTTHTVAEHLLAPVFTAYLERYPGVDLELILTERTLDLVEEGLDGAIRVGVLPDSGLVATRLGAARIRYVAAPGYLKAQGAPLRPEDLLGHRALVHPLGPGEPRWPFWVEGRMVMVPVRPRLRANSAEVVRAAALAGHGIALLAEPVCAPDLATGALRAVLEEQTPDVGGIWLVTPGRRRQAARVRAFVALAGELNASR